MPPAPSMSSTPVRIRRPRLKRVATAAPRHLTASQREVVELLHEYNFLTPRLLAIAYGARHGRAGKGYWHLQRELRRLFDAGLVHRFNGTVGSHRAGSVECVYAASHVGTRAILDHAEYAAARKEIYTRERGDRANFQH